VGAGVDKACWHWSVLSGGDGSAHLWGGGGVVMLRW